MQYTGCMHKELIAIGSNNSADDATLLIEYAYIYEPQFLKQSVRSIAVNDYAYATYLGLQDFFNDPITSTVGSMALPHDWSAVEAPKGASGPGIYALQAALHHLGYYPPTGKSFSECPISGVVGACSLDALKEYQRARGIDPAGVFGPLTRMTLEKDLATP